MNLKTDEKNETVGETTNENTTNRNEDGIKNYQKSLIIIKPDGVKKRIVGDIISRFEKAGFEIEKIRVFKIDKTIANMHYCEHVHKPFFEELVNYITSGPSVIMVIKGENAISRARELMGSTDPSKAGKGTIRGDYGTDITVNSIHGSDSPESAEREIKIFFGNYL